ncbi:hypothetical protein GW17_00051700 [Ensete ventricosum]|nr:hypothetical protein GW17_00051700 [Ensete ventricosum]
MGWPRALPLRPGCWQAPPLVGKPRASATPAAWPRVGAAPSVLAAGDPSCLRGREENKKGRLKLQPIILTKSLPSYL